LRLLPCASNFFPQRACIQNDYTVSASSGLGESRVLRAVKALRILKIIRLLKILKFFRSRYSYAHFEFLASRLIAVAILPYEP